MNLIEASIIGNLEEVKKLLANGADIHAQNDHAFAAASEEGHLEILNYLREKEKNQ